MAAGAAMSGGEGSNRAAGEKAEYTSMAAARAALTSSTPRLRQVANTCLLLEYLAYNEVNTACLAAVGGGRLQVLLLGLLRAAGNAAAQAW